MPLRDPAASNKCKVKHNIFHFLNGFLEIRFLFGIGLDVTGKVVVKRNFDNRRLYFASTIASLSYGLLGSRRSSTRSPARQLFRSDWRSVPSAFWCVTPAIRVLNSTDCPQIAISIKPLIVPL